jgi:hypothetical protein
MNTATSNEFSLFIEKLSTEKRLTKLDAILEYCNENFIDPDDIVPHISKSLKDKIEMELQHEGKLPKSSTMSIL